jgi:acetyl esterase/lipase
MPDDDPHIEAARANAREFCAGLAQVGRVLPPFATPAEVAAWRAAGVPEALRNQPTVLPVEAREVPGRDGPIAVRIVRPANEPRGVYLDIHGGGFCIGWAVQHDQANAHLALDTDLVFVSVDYRLAPEHPYPAGAHDCEDVARWLLDHAAAELGTDVVFIGGDSAGGNLALRTALVVRDAGHGARLAGLHLVYGIFDLSLTPSARAGIDTLVVNRAEAEMFNRYYVPGASAEALRDPAISPLYADLSGLPPALVLVGDADMLLDDSLFLDARLRSAGIASELVVFPDAPHGFTSLPLAYAALAHARAAEWLRARLADAELRRARPPRTTV